MTVTRTAYRAPGAANAKALILAPATCQPSGPAWTTPPRWPAAGRSPPASSKEHAGGQDRKDLTVARWGLDGAEAILKLRALIASGDYGEYRPFHLRQEHQRVHRSRYELAA